MLKQAPAGLARRSAHAIVISVCVVMTFVTGGASAASSPVLTTSPATAAPGASIRASGSGFTARTPVAFTWDGAPADAPFVRTRRDGSFGVTLQVPALADGDHTLAARTGTSSASATVHVAAATPTATSTPTPLPPTATPTPVVPTPTPAPAGGPHIGSCATLPADNIWNTRVDTLPVHALSSSYMTSIGNTVGLHPDFGTVWNGAPNGIPFVTVPGSQSRVGVSFTYADESDPGPYPIPPDAPIEGGPSSSGDRHVLVVDRDNCVLYELFAAYPQPDGSWTAGSGAIFPLNSDALRPSGWTSADAAGLPILPGLVRYDEVTAGVIAHALRFTAVQTQRAFVWPARHYASSNTSPSVPPMGTRLRLKASVDISQFSAANQVILQALKTYGMFLADNGSNLFISGAPDSRWNDSDLANLRQIVGSNLEVVDEAPLQVDPNSAQAR
jgi:hypothetical protein